jgi:DNA-binding IclR family transcriptional regulator
MIGSVGKALDILRLFNADEPSLTLTEISHRLGMPKSTVHHLLTTLAHYGFVERDDSSAYALGRAIIALTQGVLVNVDVRDRAAPLLRMMADSCNESVYLTIRDQDQALYIYAIESSRRLLARTAVGDRVPLYCTSLGKAILAFLPTGEIERILSNSRMVAFTPYSIVQSDILRRELALTRDRGYALDNQEHELGTYCVGAPIFDPRQSVIGSCSVSGVDPDIVGTRLDALAASVMSTAQEVSRRMGFVPAHMSMVRSLNQD